MKQVPARLRDGISIFSRSRKVYKKLQKHLDKQPIGYPATITGVERRILREVFTLDEAYVAFELDYKCQSFETILEKMAPNAVTESGLRTMLHNMERNGAIFVKMVDGKKQYALHPFVVGIYEMRLPHMTADFYLDIRKYMYQSFGMEFLSTEPTQMRVIPIRKSVAPDMNIATYDEIRELVLQSDGRIVLAECVCRKGMDLVGRACKETERREVCIGFRDFHDMYARNGFGRSIAKEEAFDVLDRNEKDGLVLMSSNAREAQFVCSCCKCCCGALEMVSLLARPADFVKSNFYAALDGETCVACGKCAKKCTTAAIDTNGKKATGIDRKRCLGCGVCVAFCTSGALSLKKKDTEFIPPKDFETLYDVIMGNKKGTIRRALHMAKAVIS